MTDSSRVRILHLIAALGGGGSERWLRDIVRLSPPGLEHRIQTVYPHRIVKSAYSDELRALGAYHRHTAVLALNARRMPGFESVWARRPRWLRTAARGAACAGALARTPWTVARFRPDVIHSHTLIDFVVGLVASRAWRVPLVHTVPCLFSQMAADGYGWVPALYSRVHPCVACFSAGENQSELTQVGVPTEKLFYDLGGVDLEAADAVQARRAAHATDVRRHLNLPDTCPIALSVGRLEHSKGHMAGVHAVKAMVRRLPDIQFVVLGEGVERARLETAAAELGVLDRVHLVGFVPDPLPYYAASDIYFRTTLFELENFAFYTAMAMGLPVIGFDTGEGRDLVRTVGCGIQVPRADVTSFARAAARVLEMDDRGRAMAAGGAVWARRHLDLERSVMRLSALYRELTRADGRAIMRESQDLRAAGSPG